MADDDKKNFPGNAGSDAALEKPRGFLSRHFNAIASFGAGAVAGYAIKTAAVAFLGSSVAAVGAAAAGIGAVSAAIHRWRDVAVYNEAHAEDRAGYFDLAKTGHSKAHYLKKAAVSAGFSFAGGLIGMGVSSLVHASFPAIVQPGGLPDPVDVPLPPVVAPVDPAPYDALAEAKKLIPADACKDMQVVLHRLESTNVRVKAQAVKDLGYFFANGFCGVQENDALANNLFELSIETSGGKNIQALHDLGYQNLHGLGMDKPDYTRAFNLLTKADEGGHPLAPPLLNYMNLHNLAPR